jgi:hypothetical protein
VGDWDSAVVYIDIASVSPRFLAYLESLLASCDGFVLHKVISFEFKGLVHHKALARQVKQGVQNSKIERYLYVQSLEPIFCRYLASIYSRYVSYTCVVGLQFSMPVFLFRDPGYVSQLVANKELQEFLIWRAKKIQDHVRFSFSLGLLKKKLLDLIECVFDLWLVDKRFRKNRMVKATSYVQRGTVDVHLVGKPYYKFCIDQLYDEQVELVESHSQAGDGSSFILDKNTKDIDLIILGPVSMTMLVGYLSDVSSLRASGFILNKVCVKSHPRFRSLADHLVNELRTRSGTEMPVSDVSVIETIALDADSSVVLGYYSSLFDELASSGFKGSCIISERATSDRYPEMPVNILSGENFGFNNPYLMLGSDGGFTKSSKTD